MPISHWDCVSIGLHTENEIFSFVVFTTEGQWFFEFNCTLSLYNVLSWRSLRLRLWSLTWWSCFSNRYRLHLFECSNIRVKIDVIINLKILIVIITVLVGGITVGSCCSSWEWAQIIVKKCISSLLNSWWLYIVSGLS